MSLLDLASSKELVAVVVGTIATVVYAYTLKRFLLSSRERRAIRSLKLHKAISSGLHNGTLLSVEDFINVYKGVYGLGADDISYRAGLAKALRQYIVWVVSGDQLEQADATRLKDSATSVLTRIEAESPFADLPPAERNLLLDVDRFIKAKDESSAMSKIEDLASLIQVRQDTLERVQSSNRWSIPLAIIGLILTITFGLVSLVK